MCEFASAISSSITPRARSGASDRSASAVAPGASWLIRSLTPPGDVGIEPPRRFDGSTFASVALSGSPGRRAGRHPRNSPRARRRPRPRLPSVGNNRCRRVVLAVLTVAALLTGSVPAAFAAPSAGGPPAGAAPAGAPAPLEFAPCGEGLNCATLVVPVDHTDPDGATTELPVLRHRATDPARRLGVLLVNPGGPGAPAGDQVRLLVGAIPEVPATLGPEVLARYDVIGLDPRGTGGPGTVRCLTDAQREEALDTDLDPDLPGGQDRAAVLAATRELTEGCAARNDVALLSQLATDDVARDMDLLRSALGEQQISYFGVSYGTLLGATYATLFPERVQHMVLDSPVHPTSWQQQPLRALTEQAASGEQVLGAYFAACVEAGPDCPFGAGRPAEAFDALVDRLEATPLVVPATENTPAGRVDGATLAAAARVAVFDRGLWR